MSKNYYLFISHSWKYDEHYRKIKEWIDDSSISWNNYSVPIDDCFDYTSKSNLEEKIREQMRHASVVVVLAGMYASHSDWIEFEIDQAYSMGKKILGVKPWGQERIPNKVQLFSDKMVGWNSLSVIEGIKELG